MVTAAGHVEAKRRYYACRQCGLSQTPFDDWAGVEKGRLTVGARRLVSLAGTSWSFDRASVHLRELTGLEVSDQTIRRVTEAEGCKARAWLESSSLATTPVSSAAGHGEFYTDGTMVNTRRGWREVRLSVFGKRAAGPPSEPATATTLESRTLPRPTARLALASRRGAKKMGDLWRHTAQRLGWGRGAGVSAIADGAKWITAQVEKTLPEAERVLDVYHVSQHLHQCGAALHGEETPQARAWARDQLSALLRQGPTVLLWRLEREAEGQRVKAKRAALNRLLNYLRPNQTAMRYKERLRRGLPIGSGQVEGACKTIVGRRLKLNSARWCDHHVEAMASLCCLDYSTLRETYWASRAA